MAVAKEMPCPRDGSPCFHEVVSRRWSQAASLCQTLPVVVNGEGHTPIVPLEGTREVEGKVEGGDENTQTPGFLLPRTGSTPPWM